MKKKGGSLRLNLLEENVDWLLSGIEILQKALDAPFLESYLENLANLLDGKVQVVEGVPNKEDVTALTDLYQQMSQQELDAETKRKISQLLLLKGAKEDHLSANHQLTPDAIGFLYVFLLESLFKNEKEMAILDTALGMGNLLATVIEGLALSGKKVKGYGVENDDLLIEIAAANSEWFGQDTQFFHQDALQGLLLEPMDAVISDLPVGYYPNDDKAKEFMVGKDLENEHTYAHHLLIEASFQYVKPGGFGIYLVPTKLFDSPQAANFVSFMSSKAYLQGMIALPPSLFINEASQKSIMILQKPGEEIIPAKEVLLVQLKSLKDPKENQHFFQEFAKWQHENLKK